MISVIKLSIATFAALSIVACATPKAGSTNITSADAPASEAASMPSSSTSSSSSAAAPKEANAADAPAAPEGTTLVCSAPTSDGTTELYLKWDGEEASGVVRTIAPSGSVSEQRVHAARYKGRIIADEPGNQDLVKHVAVVKEENGKKMIRIEEMASIKWLDCAK